MHERDFSHHKPTAGEYEYNPAPSEPTGDPQKVYAEGGRYYTKKDTPSVGKNGTYAAYRARFGARGGVLPAGRTYEQELIAGLSGPSAELPLPRQIMPDINVDGLGTPEEE